MNRRKEEGTVAKPTKEQLEKINKLAVKELTEDDVFVFRPLIIDDQVTAYYSKLHENFLRKIVMDAKKGVGLLLNHNCFQLPVGRTFDAELVEEHDEEVGDFCKSVYGGVYIDRGRNTESNMTTDDIIKGIESGTIFDVSIGFNASSWKCSICGNDIRDYMSCPHIPGKKYIVQDEEGNDIVETCIVNVGEDGEGELLELSLVYAGACGRATIKNEFSNDSVIELDKGTKLTLVDNFKNVPLYAKIYQYYSKDGVALYTDTDERTEGAEYLAKRSETEVILTKLYEIMKNTFGIEVSSEEELISKLSELGLELSKVKEELAAKESELSAKNTELETANSELAKAVAENEQLKTDLANKDVEIAELNKKAEIVETYRQELTDKALNLGVKLQGNAFQRELFSKFLETLSLDEIKNVVSGFEAEVRNKFAGVRVSEGEDRSLTNRVSDVPDKDENPAEFSAYVAEKAIEYAKEHGISISEATKLMYKKYSNKDGSDS